MKLLFLLPFILFGITANATNYYISANGNDANNGISISTPWKSLNKLNSYFSLLKPGDNILFNRGDVFYGNIMVNKSGTAGSPITIGAYGSGADPVITGFTNVTAWTNLGSNIWESTSAVSTLSTCNMVVINGVNTAMGRTPNSGYYTFQSHSGTTSITSSSLNSSVINWTGAEAVVKSTQYTLDRSVITSASGSTINYGSIAATPTDNFGFFIQNDVRTLDVQNEWYYNPSTKKIRVYSTTSPTNVQVSTTDKLVTVSGAYITFSGIDFTGANSYGFFNNTAGMNNLYVENCTISFSGIDGFNLAGCANFTFNNSTISNSNNDGIKLYFANPNTTITNSTFQNIGNNAGMGQSNVNTYMGVLSVDDGLTFTDNTITNIGYIGINFQGNNILVQHNLIDTFCTLLGDGGGIYTVNHSGTTETNRVIDGNIVINGIGNNDGTNTSNKYAFNIS